MKKRFRNIKILLFTAFAVSCIFIFSENPETKINPQSYTSDDEAASFDLSENFIFDIDYFLEDEDSEDSLKKKFIPVLYSSFCPRIELIHQKNNNYTAEKISIPPLLIMHNLPPPLV